MKNGVDMKTKMMTQNNSELEEYKVNEKEIIELSDTETETLLGISINFEQFVREENGHKRSHRYNHQEY
jgi:hypothetical protein